MSDSDPLVAIHAALQRDHVYVAPSLAGQVSPAQLRAIERNIAASPQPVYVVMYPFADDDAYSGSTADLLTRLHQAYPDPGTYLATTTQLTLDDYSGIRIDGRQWGIPGQDDGDLDNFSIPYVVSLERQPTLGAAFERATGLLNAGPDATERAYDRAKAADDAAHPQTGTSTDTGTGTASEDDTGSGGGVSGLVVALIVLAVLVTVALGLLVRLRGPARRRPAAPAFALPESAMDHIRRAHDRRLEQQARDELLALGEKVDGNEIASGSDTRAWQAAIDHYEAAGRVLARRSPDDGAHVLDVVGALVLVRRGRTALDAALRRRAWTPPRCCYLDPLHGEATVTRVVDTGGGGRAREVPLCRDCRADVDADRRPDILDVERHGKPVHWFDAGVEPWASTGYGCFGDDLVEALRRDLR